MKLLGVRDRVAKGVTAFRVLRSIRMIRMLRVCRELRIMVTSIISTVRTLGWAIFCLVMIQLGFSLFFLTITTDYQSDHGQMLEFQPFFGSMPRMVLSLFQITTGGFDWRELSDLLSFSPVTVFVLCLYVSMMFYAIMNILIGICCETASKTAEEDFEVSIVAEQEREDNAITRLKQFFADVDSDGSGNITWKELDRYLQRRAVHTCFKKLGLERWHLKTFFDLLKSEKEEDPAIGIDDFVRGCTRLRYNVKNIDLIAASHSQQDSQMKRFNELNDKIDSLYTALVVPSGEGSSKLVFSCSQK